ncbi:hypothetical protein PV325_010504 [Microctonus aethiopoides]|nr:hypothetical protein PV325_010504 [Microctonus aethiopoides]
MLEFADTLAERQHGVKEGFVMSQQMQSRWYIKRDDNYGFCTVPSYGTGKSDIEGCALSSEATTARQLDSVSCIVFIVGEL